MASKRILVVDDEEVIVDLLTEILTDQGYEVDSAFDAASALAKVRENIYDAAILDFNLPDMNGVMLHREIRQMDEELASNTLFASGVAQSEESAEEFALRYIKAVTAEHDREKATEMLCRENYRLLKANLDMQIDLWLRPEVVVQPHDFRVVNSIELPNYDVESSPTHKVWVAYKYTWLYEGKEIDIDLSEGYHIYLDRFEDGFCAMPNNLLV